MSDIPRARRNMDDEIQGLQTALVSAVTTVFSNFRKASSSKESIDEPLPTRYTHCIIIIIIASVANWCEQCIIILIILIILIYYN